MSVNRQNRHIARLLVGAMSIDGELTKEEQAKVATTLSKLGLDELIADVGAVLEEDQSAFNMFEETRELIVSLGSDAEELAPVIFRLITDVVASDRFVSSQEASYLSALSRRLKLTSEQSKKIFKAVMAERRGRLEISGSDVDENIHPHLKELLSFTGSDKIVGEIGPDSLQDMLAQAQAELAEGCEFTIADVEHSLATLGLGPNAGLDEAKEIWRETIDQSNLPKMADLGETFVTAAISRISRINDAYRTVQLFHDHLDKSRKAKTEAERLGKQIERAKGPSTRDILAPKLEEELTGVGVVAAQKDER